jgi:hypothetical protein
MSKAAEDAMRQIAAAVSALYACMEKLRREESGRESSQEVMAAARAVREMQDAVALLVERPE